MAKKKVTINLDDSAIKRIKEIAKSENRSVSNMIEVLIIDYRKGVKNG